VQVKVKTKIFSKKNICGKKCCGRVAEDLNNKFKSVGKFFHLSETLRYHFH
jgi:hypothetical protein